MCSVLTNTPLSDRPRAGAGRFLTPHHQNTRRSVLRKKKRHDTVVSVLSTACALPNRESRNENRAGAAAPGHIPFTRGQEGNTRNHTRVRS